VVATVLVTRVDRAPRRRSCGAFLVKRRRSHAFESEFWREWRVLENADLPARKIIFYCLGCREEVRVGGA